MFTHPALLRDLNALGELLRGAGEPLQARRVADAADALRREGWTDATAAAVRALRGGRPGLDQVAFGEEHHRRVGGPAGARAANARLDQLRERLILHGELPTRPAQPGPRRKSPDL